MVSACSLSEFAIEQGLHLQDCLATHRAKGESLGNEKKGRGSAPPPVAIPVPLVTSLAFPGLAWLASLLVGKGDELHILVRAAAFADRDFARFEILLVLVESRPWRCLGLWL